MKRRTGYIARGVKQDKLSFQGPPKTRAQQLELTQPGISYMGQRMKAKSVPIQVEHSANIKETPVTVGRVINNQYHTNTGDWEIEFEFDDSPAARDTIAAMELCGFHSLSLSHDPTTMEPIEVSICLDPARKGSIIKELNHNSYNVPVGESLYVVQATMQQQSPQGLPTFQNAGNYPPPPGEQAAKQLNQQLAAHAQKQDQPMESKNDNHMDTSSGSTPAPTSSDAVLDFVKNQLAKGLITHDQASKLLESNIATKQQFLELESKNLKQAEELERSRRQAGNQSDNMVNILARLVQKFGKSTRDQKAYQPQDMDQFRQNARSELQQKGHFAMDGNVLPQLVQAAESAMTFVESKPDPGLEEFNSRMALALKLEEQRNQLKRQYQANQEPWQQQQQSSSSSSYKQPVQQQPRQGMVEASAFGTMTQRYGDEAMNRLLHENERLLQGNGSDVGFNFSVPTAGFDQTAETQGAARKRKFTGAY